VSEASRPASSTAKGKTSTVISMTGFGGSEGTLGGHHYRVEVKSVNHRFLDLKIRLPRELHMVEGPLKALVQSRFTRGAIELKVERVSEGAAGIAADLSLNIDLARRYQSKIKELQTALGLKDHVTTLEIANFPDVLTRGSADASADETWKRFEPFAVRALDGLAEMRAHEGASLGKILLDAAAELEATISSLREKRKAVAAKYPERIREKIRGIFEAYPLSEANLQAVLEARISQELAMIADRTDIEEELVRFQGHLDHLRKVLREGGQVGRKLDFVLQELNREINTLGNKAQDYGMSEEVVGAKVKLEQLREQVMNLE
jgi:uncharacterized protein (TIGR00255 family)